MALKTTTEINFKGIPLTYHRLKEVLFYDFETGIITFDVAQYVDKETRDADSSNYLNVQRVGNYQLDVEVLKSQPVNFYDALYAELKKLPEYENAEDA